MGYDLEKVEYVKAIKWPKWTKTDVHVQIKIIIKLQDQIDIQNISAKLVSNESGFNQIDKRWVADYNKLWNIPKTVFDTLEHFCWMKKPYISNVRDTRRMFLDEIWEQERHELIDFFYKNKIMIVSDIIRWRWEFCVEWMLVIRKYWDYEWVLKPINEVMNYFWTWEVRVTGKGSLKIWKIWMQRKWWDSWRHTANMLQFKLDPTELFNL